MANERQWDAVPPVSLTSDGTTEGVLQVTDTIGFFFGMQATLKNNASLQLTVYIKRVVNSTTLWVGAAKGGLDHNVDISAFTVATASTIEAGMQNKSTVPMEARLLATYATDPIDAWRVEQVDPYGNPYTGSNPLPVAIEGSITVSDVHVLGRSPANNELDVNADGSINVDIVNTNPIDVNVVNTAPSNKTVVNIYNEVNSVAMNSLTTIVTYTVPPTFTSILERVSVAGENIAVFQVLINATVVDTRRTFFGNLNEYFEFDSPDAFGTPLNTGDTVTVTVIHYRPFLASFESRIQVTQVA